MDLPIALPPLALADVNKLLEGLGYLPHMQVRHLIDAIKQQGDAQVDRWVQAQQPEKAVEAEPPEAAE